MVVLSITLVEDCFGVFEELAQDIGVAAEAHVDAGLHHLDQVVEAGGRVRV